MTQTTPGSNTLTVTDTTTGRTLLGPIDSGITEGGAMPPVVVSPAVGASLEIRFVANPGSARPPARDPLNAPTRPPSPPACLPCLKLAA